MPRTARIVAPGYPHHITQRGNNKQDVFFVDEDMNKYLSILMQESVKHKLTVLGYCLMTNHIHLVATPEEPEHWQARCQSLLFLFFLKTSQNYRLRMAPLNVRFLFFNIPSDTLIVFPQN